jgi:hypothetical protein
MKRLTVLVLALGIPVGMRAQIGSAESRQSLSWRPRPMLLAGPSLLGNGYQTSAMSLGAGLLLNSRRMVSDVEGRYTNAKKTNDNTVGNRKGHERFLQGRAFYRYRPGLYFGGGAQWSETSTTNYTKAQWRPTFGLGGDHFGSDYSLRWQALYIMPGTDKLNGLQGPEFQFWLPSPASGRHFFFRETLGIYEFHTTITDPTDRTLTAQQIANRSHAAFLDFTFGWRF